MRPSSQLQLIHVVPFTWVQYINVRRHFGTQYQGHYSGTPERISEMLFAINHDLVGEKTQHKVVLSL